ncbi:MAG TPA: N-acetyl-gamma-glutamyl-phosphate reductase [Polyangiaceae bacterium]
MVQVGVVGASGYTGAVCASLVASHPKLELAFATSDKRAGDPVDGCKIHFSSHDEAEKLAAGVDAVFLATSAEHAMKLAPKLAEKARVIDLSGAFRLDAASYPKWYGFEHEAPDALERAWYGLPELFGPPPDGARIVSSPGCYATAALLAIAPLVREGLAAGDRIVLDGKSGVTGAGRKSDEAYSFVELAEELRAYKIGAHQHTPEIARHLGRYARIGARVTFTPHLVPLRRGLLVTAYLDARDATTETVQAALSRAYADAPLVRVVAPERATVHAVAGTPLAYVGASVSEGTIVSVCAIDNLMKGAASQAMQNLNLAFGWPEAMGLSSARFAP